MRVGRSKNSAGRWNWQIPAAGQPLIREKGNIAGAEKKTRKKHEGSGTNAR